MNLTKTNITDIRVVYKSEEFEMFYAGLSENVKKKFDYVLNVVQTVYSIPQKFIKKLENTDFYVKKYLHNPKLLIALFGLSCISK